MEIQAPIHRVILPVPSNGLRQVAACLSIPLMVSLTLSWVCAQSQQRRWMEGVLRSVGPGQGQAASLEREMG